VCWYEQTGSYGNAVPVGAHPERVGPFGTFQQSGNVWEWCADWFDGDAYQRYANGDFSSAKKRWSRVLRGLVDRFQLREGLPQRDPGRRTWGSPARGTGFVRPRPLCFNFLPAYLLPREARSRFLCLWAIVFERSVLRPLFGFLIRTYLIIL
jgi:hypothetical protein